MRCRPFLSILLTALFAFSLSGSALPGDTTKPIIENYEKYIGRELVIEDRAVNAKLNRPLPLSCPPFHLRDEKGDIIDPTKDAEGNPVDPNLPVQQQGIPRAVSTKKTCGACHDYNRVTRGYHFQAGRDELYPEPPSGDTPAADRGPGFFGKWQALYQRELAPKHFEDPNEVDLPPFQWMVDCGVCHPGGGPAEYDRSGQRYDDVLKLDRGVTMFGDGDYHESAWDKTGVMEADCFICHLDSYEYSIRAQQIKKLNFKFAATAAAGFGYVWGSVRDGQQPKVYYKKDLFRSDGTVFLHIRRPSDRQCTQCHDMSSVQKRGSSWHNHYIQDVHSDQGLTCTDCHNGDIRHNFAKGNSSSQSIRDDLDNTNLSCKKCHEASEHGAPNYSHPGLPPLHLERIACEACHITHRPFTATGVVDSLTGKPVQLPAQTDPQAFDSYAFGAMWGTAIAYDKENILKPFTAAELEKAAQWRVTPDAPLRKYFQNADGSSRLPDGSLPVADIIAQKGGLDSEDARALMLLALRDTAGAGNQGDIICVFRGHAYMFDEPWIKKLEAKLQPRRPGATIAESPFDYARSKNDGMIYPESCQLGVFWAYQDGDLVRPLFPKDMKAAWDFLTNDEYKFAKYPGPPAAGGVSPGMPRGGEAGEPEAAETPPVETAPAADAAQPAPENAAVPAEQPPAEAAPPRPAGPSEADIRAAVRAKLSAYAAADRRLLEIFDDNNDSFPEVNTEDEMGLIAWALKQTCGRAADRNLYYIKGANVWRVQVDAWRNPYDLDVTQMDAIGENEPFICVERYEQVEQPGPNSWDKPSLTWQLAERRLARPYNAMVEPVDPKTNTALAALARRLPWTVSHGVEPAQRALGAQGCTDCHAAGSHFFFGAAVVDPFQVDATPQTIPMHRLMGYLGDEVLIGAWREGVLKPLAPWIVLAVLAMILLHFVLVGSKSGSVPGVPNVLRFRFYERLSHLIAMTTVVFLAVTGFFFLLGKNDPLGAWARLCHTYLGYGAVAGTTAIFLVWFLFMLPAKGDLRWMLKAGGYLGGVKGHLPAGKFNAGQKILFWIAIAAMALLSSTGLMMALHRGEHFPRQELIYTVHDAAGLLMILVLMAHVYLATIVVPHSLRAVFGGKVSDIWAREHHSNWKFKIKS